MTTEEKKAALIEAGVKVRSNASDETIAELWGEHLAMIEEHGPIVTDDIEPVEDVVPFEAARFGDPIPDLSPAAVTYCQAPPSDIMAEYAKVLKEHGTKQLGPRTPAVYDWADANLPADEWNKIYAGKRYNGEILQPKV